MALGAGIASGLVSTPELQRRLSHGLDLDELLSGTSTDDHHVDAAVILSMSQSNYRSVLRASDAFCQNSWSQELRLRVISSIKALSSQSVSGLPQM